MPAGAVWAPATPVGAGASGSTIVEVVVPRIHTPTTHHVPVPTHGPHGLPYTGARVWLLLALAVALIAAGTCARLLAAYRKDV